jgi:SNF2 family DNA or RNA helicase
MNNMIMQLRKVCNHPYLFLDSFHENEDLMRVSGKFELLDRIIPKLIRTGHRMLIFTQMTQLIDILQYFLMYRNIKHLRLDGSTKLEERAIRMALFNQENSEYSIFLLSTRAGGLGLNLQTADTVILFDSDWNPQMDLQAQDRAHRIGTMKEVRVFRLVTNGTIEENILSKASYKRNLDEMIIQAGLYNNKSTDVERRQRLEEIIKKSNLDKDDNEIPNDR